MCLLDLREVYFVAQLYRAIYNVKLQLTLILNMLPQHLLLGQLLQLFRHLKMFHN